MGKPWVNRKKIKVKTRQDGVEWMSMDVHFQSFPLDVCLSFLWPRISIDNFSRPITLRANWDGTLATPVDVSYVKKRCFLTLETFPYENHGKINRTRLFHSLLSGYPKAQLGCYAHGSESATSPGIWRGSRFLPPTERCFVVFQVGEDRHGNGGGRMGRMDP